MTNQQIDITIPPDVDFSDLRLLHHPDGSYSIDFAVVERVCQSSDLDVEFFCDPLDEALSSLLVGWYQAHRQRGGNPDPVAEVMISEAVADAGKIVLHQPGHA